MSLTSGIFRVLCATTMLACSSSGGQAGEFTVDWQHTYGGASNDFLFGIAETANGYLLAGYSNSGSDGDKTASNHGENDYWIVRIDEEGTVLWDLSLGGTDQDLLAAVLSVGDEFIVGGTSLSGTNGNKTAPSIGLRDYWVLKLADDGTVIWDKAFGGSGSDYLQDIKIDGNGNLLLGGYSFSGTNGNKTAPSYGLLDYWVVKTDAQGTIIWDQSCGSGGNDYLAKIDSVADGGVILGGYSFSIEGGTKTAPRLGGSDYWIIRLDQNGHQIWDKTYGGTGNEYCQGVLALPEGGFIVSGYSYSDADGNKTTPSLGMGDYWILKLDDNGNKLWETSLGGSGEDNAWCLARLNENTLLIGGWSDSPPGTLKTGLDYGRSDFWLTLLSGAGQRLSDYSLGGSEDEVILGIHVTPNHGCLMGGYSFSGTTGSKTSPNQGGCDFWVAKLDPVDLYEHIIPHLSVNQPLRADIDAHEFRFILKGQPEQSYILEYSADLMVWTPFATNTLTSMEMEITAPKASPGTRRFYRAMVKP